MRYITDTVADHLGSLNTQAIAAIDARGFIFGAPVAGRLDIPFIPIRKAGKLPPPVVGTDYDLEYGTGRLEVRTGAVEGGQRVVVIDDLLATGGSAGAGVKLITSLGANVVSVTVLVELEFLNGRAALPADLDVFSRPLFSSLTALPGRAYAGRSGRIMEKRRSHNLASR